MRRTVPSLNVNWSSNFAGSKVEHPDYCQGFDLNLDDEPHIFTSAWGEKTSRRQVVIVYGLWFGCMVPGWTVTVFENYLWENGKAGRTSDNMLSGYLTQTELLTSYPDKEQYWVLVSAMMAGCSGRLLPRQALLLQIGVDGVKIIWQTPVLGDLTAHAHQSDGRWEVSYVDDSLYPNGTDEQVLDVYQLSYTSQKIPADHSPALSP
ncbi:MAG: hypothetical protein JO210_00290 [Acidobacteriaceae bacterium]|nr:hypothetical protein [Acidobacteriaceae bacterium]